MEFDRKQDLNVLYQFSVFRAYREKMATLASDIFNFSSETTEWNSMKLDRKQDPNVLFQVRVKCLQNFVNVYMEGNKRNATV